MYDIISIGDATVDVFLQLSDENAEVKCQLHREECQLCLDFADKIPVEKVTRIPGSGNASNNAVGSARLGMKTAIFSILGDDDVGHSIHAYWKRQGVGVGYVTFDKQRGSNYSTVLNFNGERTILVFHEKRTYVFPKRLDDPTWVYYTSLGKGSEKMHPALVAFVKKTGAKLCFQPGTFQLKLGAHELEPIIAASAVTIMNKEEAERLVGDETRSINVLLKRLRTLGCEIAVITDGPNGSYTYDGKTYLKMGTFEVPVIERTGCGDAYATAFVAALHHGKNVGEAMRWGTANAASVLGYIGPQEGLLKTASMKKMLARFSDIKPQQM